MTNGGNRFHRFGVFLVAILSTSVVIAGQSPPTRSDAAAVTKVAQMIETLGGRAIWGGARTLYLRYEGVMQFTAEGSIDDVETAWRDLREPAERIEHKGGSVHRVSVMTPQGGWRLRQGVFSQVPMAEHSQSLEFWKRDFYTMLRRLASGDTELVLKSDGERRVLVQSSAGADWGWFEIDGRGLLLKWGAPGTSGATLEYVYGPLASYGPIRFPKWVASIDGRWRADYVEVRVGTDALPVSLLTPPQKP